jgi:hypothetical protein
MRVIVVVLFACAWITTACKPGADGRQVSQGDMFNALVYTSGFAKRFRLPVESSIDLDPGVLAIAIRVHRDVQLDPICNLILYIDDSVPFAYPNGSEGRLEDLRAQTGPLFFSGKLNQADTEASLARFADLRVMYRSRVLDKEQKHGVYDGGPIAAFWRSLLPNLNVVSYTILCYALSPSEGPADLWLLREGHETTELKPAAPREDVAVRVGIPDSLLKLASDATARAAKEPVNLKPPAQPPYVVLHPAGGPN